MISEPKIEQRAEQPCASIRTQVTLQELGMGVIPQLDSEVMDWLKAQGLSNAGASFIRYRVINMAEKLDIEVGWPVASPVTGDGRVIAGVLPAGRYGTILYTGPYEGNGLMEANRALIEWAQAKGIKWDNWQEAAGDAFGSRFESYLVDPGDEPDPAKWVTEVAIRIADES